MPIPVTLIPGDGIGPSIAEATVRILAAAGADIEWDRQVAGMAGASRGGMIRFPTRRSTRSNAPAWRSKARSKPRWATDSVRSMSRSERRSIYTRTSDRPTRSCPGRFDNIDIVLVRENTEGLYIGVEHYVRVGDDPKAAAESTAIITRFGSERIVRYAFEYALAHGRKKVTLVHKANILKFSQGLFLDVGRMVAREYEGRIQFEERIIDAMAMHLVLRPEQFDVVVTTNLFGDILSDEISGLVGGLGLAPGANIGPNAAIFEAVHGTAPDLAGKNVANPGALLLAACLMLEHLGHNELAAKIRKAFEDTLKDGVVLTRDVGGTATTDEFTNAVIAKFA